MPKVKRGQQPNVSLLLHAQLDRLEMAFEKVRQMLSGRLHDFIRKQIVERADPSGKLANGRSSSPAAHHLSTLTEENKTRVSPALTLASPTL
jgi:arogenate dehydrogenase (NADP+), plant